MKLFQLSLFLFCLVNNYSISAQETTSSTLFQLLHAPEIQKDLIPQHTQVLNVESLNSDKLDYSPIPFKNGIVFTSTRKEHKQWWKNIFKRDYSYLFYAEKGADGQFYHTHPIKGNINAIHNEGTATFSSDGKLMIFTRNSKKKNESGYYDLKLFAADNNNGKWTNVRELPLNSFNYSTSHPSLSADGNRLYFASDRPGGYGGMDIYVSEWIDNRWHEPINLGARVNSASQELFPFVNELEEVYFSSSDAQGQGRLDIYVTKKQADDNWTAKQNLGIPFNSPFDDFGFYMNKDGSQGYFTSNRIGGFGGDDIYSWELEEIIPAEAENLLTKIEVFDIDNDLHLTTAHLRLMELKVDIDGQADISGPISIKNLDENLLNIIAEDIPLNKQKDGAFWFPLKEEKKYLLIAKNMDYYSYQQIVDYASLTEDASYAVELENINPSQYSDPIVGPVMQPSVANNQSIILASAILNNKSIADKSKIVDNGTLEVTPNLPIASTNLIIPMLTPVSNPLVKNEPIAIKSGKTIQLNNIYYGYNESHLNADSKKEVNEILELMLANPEMKITIKSHTDARGKSTYNQQLSQKRAEAVKSYLVAKGISADRLKAVGMGESSLLNHCEDQVPCDSNEHKENRRTEFTIEEYSINE